MKLPEMSDAKMEWRNTSVPGIDMYRDELFDGIVWRRVAAFMIDLCILLTILGAFWILVILSLGLLSVFVPLLPLIPLTYHTLMIASPRSATLGMQFMGIEVRDHAGQRPSLLQSFAMTALFYFSIGITGWLILLVALFNDRRHCAHDYLSGTVVIKSDPAA